MQSIGIKFSHFHIIKRNVNAKLFLRVNELTMKNEKNKIIIIIKKYIYVTFCCCLSSGYSLEVAWGKDQKNVLSLFVYSFIHIYNELIRLNVTFLSAFSK